MEAAHLSPMAMPNTRVALSGGSLYDLSLADSIRITGNSDTARDSPEGKAILVSRTSEDDSDCSLFSGGSRERP
jgi:hypothetical protein